jgi:hypothetical protein
MEIINLTLGVLGLLLQALVVWYGWHLARTLNGVDYWTAGWRFYTGANLLILIRRCIGMYSAMGTIVPSMSYIWPVTAEYILQIVVSLSLLVFGFKLKQLFLKYLEGDWRAMRDARRDAERDRYRDIGRDPVRDKIRDTARDLEKDNHKK